MRVIYLSSLTKMPYPAVVEEATFCVLERETLDELCRAKKNDIYPLGLHKGLVLTHNGNLLAISPDGQTDTEFEAPARHFKFYSKPCQHATYSEQEHDHLIKMERIAV